MDVLHPLCAGLDVHKDTVVACLRRMADLGQISRTLSPWLKCVASAGTSVVIRVSSASTLNLVTAP